MLVQEIGEKQLANGGFGASLATGGDFNGDGTEDLIVAAPFLDTGTGAGVGRVYAFTLGSTTAYATIDGPFAMAEFGTGLSYVGDTSSPRDGRDEIVVGQRLSASFFDGEVHVYTWNGTNAAEVYSAGGVGLGYSLLGDRIDGGKDLNADGLPDFIVGDMYHNELEVFSGRNGALLHTLDGNGEQGDFGAGRLIDDIDGDGLADLAVGAWQNSSGAPDGGKVFVYSGASGALLKTITSTGTQQNIGIDVRGLGDLNADGKQDLLVGAYGDGFSGTLPGAAIVFSNHLPAPKNSYCPAASPTDPLLADAGGDPTAGPIIGSPLEVFNVVLDCRNAPASGIYVVRVQPTKRATALATAFGWLWVAGQPLHSCAGMHNQDVVLCSPGGLVLPNDPALIGLSYVAQGFCGARLSNAIVQTIGG